MPANDKKDYAPIEAELKLNLQCVSLSELKRGELFTGAPLLKHYNKIMSDMLNNLEDRVELFRIINENLLTAAMDDLFTQAGELRSWIVGGLGVQTINDSIRKNGPEEFQKELIASYVTHLEKNIPLDSLRNEQKAIEQDISEKMNSAQQTENSLVRSHLLAEVNALQEKNKKAKENIKYISTVITNIIALEPLSAPRDEVTLQPPITSFSEQPAKQQISSEKMTLPQEDILLEELTEALKELDQAFSKNNARLINQKSFSKAKELSAARQDLQRVIASIQQARTLNLEKALEASVVIHNNVNALANKHQNKKLIKKAANKLYEVIQKIKGSLSLGKKSQQSPTRTPHSLFVTKSKKALNESLQKVRAAGNSVKNAITPQRG